MKKTEAGGAFFIFHQITDELSTKHFTRLRTTAYMFTFSRHNIQNNANKCKMKKGNMYEWAKPWNPLGGECPHQCAYCSTNSLKRYPVIKDKYSGDLRLSGATAPVGG